MLINKKIQLKKISFIIYYYFWEKKILENFKHFHKLFSVKSVKVIRYTPWSPPLESKLLKKKKEKHNNPPLLSSQSFENLKFGFWNKFSEKFKVLIPCTWRKTLLLHSKTQLLVSYYLIFMLILEPHKFIRLLIYRSNWYKIWLGPLVP